MVMALLPDQEEPSSGLYASAARLLGSGRGGRGQWDKESGLRPGHPPESLAAGRWRDRRDSPGARLHA